MTQTIGLLDYGKSGNSFNVKKALQIAGGNVRIIQSWNDFKDIDKIVLPGVGSFKEAMSSIALLEDMLVEEVQQKPTLGICLGMQILSKIGFEGGETKGLGLIDAEVKPIEVKGKVPHLGWGTLEILKKSPILNGISPEDNFYFMHSYEMVNYTNVIVLTEYSDHKFVSAIQKDTIFGVQFHPEKSREAGIQVLRNFIAI